jgi:hypothetical protein
LVSSCSNSDTNRLDNIGKQSGGIKHQINKLRLSRNLPFIKKIKCISDCSDDKIKSASITLQFWIFSVQILASRM